MFADFWMKRSRSARPNKNRLRFVPQLLRLEDRALLSAYLVTNLNDSGNGSLRAALASGDDTINFAGGLHGTITLTSSELLINHSVTINGPGADKISVSGNNARRIFDLTGNAHVTISGLTLTAGSSSRGGAVFVGGGSILKLDQDVFDGNDAVADTSGNALGGAIYNSAGATLSVDHTRFKSNETNGSVQSFGGAIDNVGMLSIDHSVYTGNMATGSTVDYFDANQANLGGAIENEDGSTMTAKNSTFTGNQVLGVGNGDALGGAICDSEGFVFPFAGPGAIASVANCTFQNNTATGGSSAVTGGFGGAIEDLPGSTLSVSNSSFSDNQANSGGGTATSGGAIDDSPGAVITISNSSFFYNSAIGVGVGASSDGGATNGFDSMTISNSAFIGNRAIAGPGADGVNTFGQANGGAIQSGFGSFYGTVTLTISNSVFADNEAVGGSGESTLAYARTGAAFGGAINNASGGVLNMSNCTVTGNRAIGGDSASGIGGDALGGGIGNENGDPAVPGVLNLTNCLISGNVAQGGAGAVGFAGGDALGGGIDSSRNAVATITNSSILLNEVIGGVGGAGANGGVGLGGGISSGAYAFVFGTPDSSTLTVNNSLIDGNVAQSGKGGVGGNGGDGLGGGIFAGGGTTSVHQSRIELNFAVGGHAGTGGAAGHGIGGGVYKFDTFTFDSTVIDDNFASTADDNIGP
jgi:hypothetical protein